MATKEAVRTGLEKVRARFEDPAVRTAFQDVHKRVQFVFPDINVAYVMTITGGSVKNVLEGTVDNPDIRIAMDSDVFLAIQNQDIRGADAFGQGKIQLTGVVSDLFLMEKYLI